MKNHSAAQVTKVLIVARTRQGCGACIGGITFDGRSVRLIAADAAFNERAGLEYQVGEVWEVDARPAESLIPPHVENVVVRAKRRLASMYTPERFIEQHMPPADGGHELLFDGLLRACDGGALYIADGGVPSCSTMFWRPDQPLARVEEGKRIRFRYPTSDGGRTLVFVGFQDPPERIPAGALLRVSLAHWWRPENRPDVELRCYAQLSGWYPLNLAAAPGGEKLPDKQAAPAASPAIEAVGLATEPPSTAAAPAVEKATAPVTPGGQRSSAPANPPGETSMPEAQGLLKSVFGYDTFRPLQAEIVHNILAGQDTLAIMPTGSGKSLCYQLPALLFDGLTVVVSPLIALMQDQVQQLREICAPAAFLNSTVEYRDYVATAQRVRDGNIKLLYTSPETLLRPETLVLLDRSRVACMVIDEAHCISSWGHDFRPEYRKLLPVRARYPSAVCAAFTATATPRVQRDIQEILGFRDANSFVASFNRENLFLDVQPRREGRAQVLAFLGEHRDQSGIIYCSTRQGVDDLAAILVSQGWNAVPYHAGLEDGTRRRNQELFSRDRAPIVVATVAFGMGISKSNVRFVVHHNLPENLETYYQEVGRAGRDGLRADCLLLFSRADMATIGRFIEEGAASESAGRRARLQAMVRFAEASDCRRKLLLEYFGEEMPEQGCGFCDNCLSAAEPAAQQDATEAARLFLACVQHSGQQFGAGRIIDVLRGSRSQDVLRWRHDRLPEYGAGRERSAQQWRDLVEQFIRLGLLQHDMEHGSLQLTAKGRQALQGGQVFVSLPAARPAAAPVPAPPYEVALFEKLRALRRELADAADLPPYVVFADSALVEMAAYLPQSPQSLLAIRGVGERKLAQYGERFLEVIRGYCAERGLAERPRQQDAAPGAAAAAAAAGKRTMAVGDAFAAGSTMADLRALYGVTQFTILDHLSRYVRSGRALDPERVLALSGLPPETRERALAAFAEHGPTYLHPIFDALEGAVSYDELHILRVYVLCRDTGSDARPNA
jgi:ATP-dependent DNA helicase RecQ